MSVDERVLGILKFSMLACAIAALPLVGCSSTPEEKRLRDLQSTFEHGANRSPSADTLYAMAKILASQGRQGTYEYTLKKIIEQYPRFLPAYCDLAELFIRQNKIEDAMATVQDGLRQGPDDAVLTNNLGMCRLLRGEYERALEHFTRAASLTPDDARYRANMAAALGLLGRYEESLNLYGQVVPASDAHHNLAILCEQRNDITRAAEEYRKAKAEREGKRVGLLDGLRNEDPAPAGAGAADK